MPPKLGGRALWHRKSHGQFTLENSCAKNIVPLGMSAGALAKKLNLPRTRIERIAKEEIGLTPDTALRLARFFNTTPEFWMNFQQAFELETEARKLAPELEKIEPLEAAA